MLSAPENSLAIGYSLLEKLRKEHQLEIEHLEDGLFPNRKHDNFTFEVAETVVNYWIAQKSVELPSSQTSRLNPEVQVTDELQETKNLRENFIDLYGSLEKAQEPLHRAEIARQLIKWYQITIGTFEKRQSFLSGLAGGGIGGLIIGSLLFALFVL